jgi:peptidylprolyl isomerase
MSLDKPEIDYPDFPVPQDLVIEDITVGSGEEAKAGQ